MCSSAHIIKVIILHTMKRTGRVLRLGKKRKHTEFWWGNLKEIFWEAYAYVVGEY